MESPTEAELDAFTLEVMTVIARAGNVPLRYLTGEGIPAPELARPDAFTRMIDDKTRQMETSVFDNPMIHFGLGLCAAGAD